jgi:hypothetical protein
MHLIVPIAGRSTRFPGMRPKWMSTHPPGDMMVVEALDWGTIREWDAYKRQYSTLFVDLDGTLVVNAGRHSQPGWGETEGIAENVAAINALYDTGKVQIVITTSRDPGVRATTLAQLELEAALGLSIDSKGGKSS